MVNKLTPHNVASLFSLFLPLTGVLLLNLTRLGIENDAAINTSTNQ